MSHQSPTRLAAVVESSEDAIISETLDGTIVTWNVGAERLFGYTAAEAVGRHIGLIVPPECRDEEEGFIARLRTGEIIRHFETVGMKSGGVMFPISLAVSPVVDRDGELVGMSRIARDISKQKAIEREAMHLAALVDSSEDAIISKNLNGIVQTWNGAAERMFGYSAADMIGQHISTIIPRDRLFEEDHVLAAIRSGASINHFETVRQRKDGTLIDISLTISPVKTPDGMVVGASKIARDITKQKELARAAQRLAAIVDSSEDAIVSTDLIGTVQTWNKAAERMFGYTADETVGKLISMIVPAERRAEQEDVLSRVRDGSGVDHFETIRRHKNGELVEVSLSVSPIRTPEGVVIGASKIAHDITSQRRLAREVEEANRVKDDFLATLSHELRTPLNAVLGYTRMLRLGHMAEERREKAIDIIERNANILSQLVADVLDVSSIVTGKIRLKPAPSDLVGVVGAAVDVVRPSADAKGVELRVHTEHAPLLVQCDVDRMQQVFWNLLSNAVKFTPRGGSVDVHSRRLKGAAEVAVTDTGIGIRAESLPFLFQRFWQAESVHSRDTGGLGLGLALVRHFAELHGGTVTASSDGEGKGATFTITLPLLDPAST
jgi:PAS domain S-box-containing protein